MATGRIRPHGPLREMARNVWTVRGVAAFPLRRNMTVIRLKDGGLVLHSVVALDEAGMKALLALGEPKIAIIPNWGHQMDAPSYQERFPRLQFLCPAGARPQVESHVRLSGTVEDAMPGLGWTLHKVPGTKIDEYVYEVPLEGGGKMLLANDVFGGANAAEESLLGRLLIAPLSVPGNRFGITRIFRMRMIRDLPAVKGFAGVLATIPDIRLIVVGHGDPVTERPAEALQALARS
jgi:hypothetical protein